MFRLNRNRPFFVRAPFIGLAAVAAFTLCSVFLMTTATPIPALQQDSAWSTTVFYPTHMEMIVKAGMPRL